MIQVSIVRRTLREGKTYEDFRRAWFHTVGFGTGTKMFSAINVANPREVIIIAMIDVNAQNASGLLATDAKERAAHPLGDVIEPKIDRTFGILVAEDDFSRAEQLGYQPPSVRGVATSMDDVAQALEFAASLLGDFIQEGAVSRESNT